MASPTWFPLGCTEMLPCHFWAVPLYLIRQHLDFTVRTLPFSLCAIRWCAGGPYFCFASRTIAIWCNTGANRTRLSKLGGRPVISHVLWESDVEMVTAKRPPEIFHSDCCWQTAHISEDGKLSGHVRDGNLHKYGPFIALNAYTILHLNVGNGVWLAEKVWRTRQPLWRLCTISLNCRSLPLKVLLES